jgi:hypothetical protein
MCSAESGGSQALGSLDSQLAEVEDVLSYVSDLLSLGKAAAAARSAAGQCSTTSASETYCPWLPAQDQLLLQLFMNMECPK